MMPPPGETRVRKCICLTGFMGSGKTTVGRLLAQQLGWPFHDLDSQIEQRSGLTIPQIFDRFGEPTFREMEYEMLARDLGQAGEQKRPVVIALGGGTIAQPRSLALLRENQCVLIWLDCPIEELLARCATISNRPLFRDESSFRALYEQRTPWYQQADYRVPSTGDPRGVVAQLLALEIFERVSA